ncbi:hypothetical protein [Streptomyces sp. NPDC054834]
MAAATPAPETKVTETAEVEAAETPEVDLDALFDAARNNLVKKKNDTRAVRGRVRQVARQRRHKRRRDLAHTLRRSVPGTVFHGLVAAGFTALALAFFATGNVAAGLTLCTVAAAAWGLAAVLRR